VVRAANDVRAGQLSHPLQVLDLTSTPLSDALTDEVAPGWLGLTRGQDRKSRQPMLLFIKPNSGKLTLKTPFGAKSSNPSSDGCRRTESRKV
jgi:hypothetical protein